MLAAALRWSVLLLFGSAGCGSEDAAPSGSGSHEASESGVASDSASESQTTSSTSSSEGTASVTTGSSASESGSSGDIMGAIDCEPRCAEQASCGPGVEETCLANCVDTQRAAEAVGEACGAAYFEFQDCETQRTCEQIEQETACEPELELVMTACAELAPPACEAVCPKWIECGLAEQQYCLGSCALQIGFARVIGSACGMAYEAVYVCEAELECTEVEMDHCLEEAAAGEKACA